MSREKNIFVSEWTSEVIFWFLSWLGLAHVKKLVSRWQAGLRSIGNIKFGLVSISESLLGSGLKNQLEVLRAHRTSVLKIALSVLFLVCYRGLTSSEYATLFKAIRWRAKNLFWILNMNSFVKSLITLISYTALTHLKCGPEIMLGNSWSLWTVIIEKFLLKRKSRRNDRKKWTITIT